MNKLRTLLSAALLFAGLSLRATEKPQEIKAPITSVKVCLNSALITHTQKVKLKSGINKLAFVGLAMNIEPRHISLRNLGKTELLSLHLLQLSDTSDITYLPQDVLGMLHGSKDSLQMMQRNIDKCFFELQGLLLEQEMLVKNDDIIPNGKQISLADLKMTTDYYRDRYATLGQLILDKQKELEQLRKNKVRALKSAFDVENSLEGNMNFCLILAELNNPEAESSPDLELSYLAREAGWIPMYEVLSQDNKSLHINYRAKILNNTGIDWNNLNIVLSTADPSQYYEAPDLDPFLVGSNDNVYSYNEP
ncbi:MAG TPA: DUF4139 domain-containing protein, partial [Bacteroidia bacterium]